MKSPIKIGTRKSALALWQAKWVASLLESANIPCELIPMETKGDRMLNVPIPEIGSKGVFTAELEQQLAAGNIDLAVHSAKDMPSELPEGFEIIAFTEREQAHDVLVSFKEGIDLDQEITIGTSSTRRTALFKYYFPAVQTVPVRGNLQTRISKLEHGDMDALALAFAGVHRMGLGGLIRHSMPTHEFVPAVGQGSMAIEVSNSIEPDKKAMIRDLLNHSVTEYCLITERAFLFTIQGGCSIPAFAHAQLEKGKLMVKGGIVSLDGKKKIQIAMEGKVQDAYKIGLDLGQKVLETGGAEILRGINTHLKQQP